ncbi:MAG: hypothetical protein COA78_24755 [Blastopirellula sp.]|nr:MAG: hypothetical protein COA78_24755 [Blastopirellula sp.]
MAEFLDGKERKWSVSLNLGYARRIKESLGLDLMQIINGQHEPIHRLVGDMELLVDVVWVLCEKQANTLNIDAMDFAEGLGGEAFDRATEALLQGIVDFFPKGKREIMQKMMARFQEKESEALDRMLAKVSDERIDKLMDQQISRQEAALEIELNKRCGDSSTN